MAGAGAAAVRVQPEGVLGDEADLRGEAGLPGEGEAEDQAQRLLAAGNGAELPQLLMCLTICKIITPSACTPDGTCPATGSTPSACSPCTSPSAPACSSPHRLAPAATTLERAASASCSPIAARCCCQFGPPLGRCTSSAARCTSPPSSSPRPRCGRTARGRRSLPACWASE
jgi:hypothetical protein